MVHGSWFTLRGSRCPVTGLFAEQASDDSAIQLLVSAYEFEQRGFRLGKHGVDLLAGLCTALRLGATSDAVGLEQLTDALFRVAIRLERGRDLCNVDRFAIVLDERAKRFALHCRRLGQGFDLMDLASDCIVHAVLRFCHAVVDADGDVVLFHILIFLSVWLLSGDRTASCCPFRFINK